MDLNQIAVFVRVVDSGSFTKAARLLKQPKSRVSRKVAALEKELGVALLYRTTRQFSPTEAGRALYESSRAHIYELEGTTSRFREHAGEVSGLIRVTAAEDFGTALLAPVISELATLHPALSVDLYLTNDTVDLVKEGLDLAIRIGDLQDATLKSRSLGSIAFILVASPEYIKLSSKVEKPQDLKRHPALAFATPGDDGLWRLEAPGKREETVAPQVSCRSNNPRVLLDLAVASKGIALIPEFLCVDALKKGILKRLLPDYQTTPVPVHFVWPPQREMSPNVRAFVEVAVKRLGKYFDTPRR